MQRIHISHPRATCFAMFFGAALFIGCQEATNLEATNPEGSAEEAGPASTQFEPAATASEQIPSERPEEPQAARANADVNTAVPATPDLSAAPRPTEGQAMPTAGQVQPTPTSTAGGASELLPPKELAFLSTQRPEEPIPLRKEAMLLVEYLVQEFPENPDSHELKARIHQLHDEPEQAEACWSIALELQPDYVFAHQGLGTLYLATSQSDEAIHHLERATKGLPDLSQVHHDLASAYLNAGQVSDSIETLEQFAQRFPMSAETKLQLGYSYLANKQYKPAQEAFEATLELAPNAARALEGLARAMVRLGERDRARELFAQEKEARKSATSAPTPQEAFEAELKEYAFKYAEIAKVLLANNQVPAAERVLKKAVAMDATNMSAWTNLISIPQSRLRFVDAAKLAEVMVEENPDNADAAYTLGILLVKAGDLPGAAKYLTRVTEIAPNDPRGFESLARLFVQNQVELERSVEIAKRAVELRGEAGDHELLAQAYALNQKMDRAKVHLEKAIELEPDNAQYRQALQLLVQFLNSQQGN